MFTNDDINGMGETSLSETQELELVPGDMNGYWESLTNLRIKREGKYPYWKLRKGLTQIQALGFNALRTYGFEARTNESANNFAPVNYLAIHKSNGSVDVYNLETDVVDYTLTGFSQTDPVQFYSSGQFLYVFDGENSKYINISTGVISGYCTSTPSSLISYSYVTPQEAQSSQTFKVKAGDRAIVFPPDITQFSSTAVTIRASETVSSGEDYKDDAFAEGEDIKDFGHYREVHLSTGVIYKHKPATSTDPSVHPFNIRGLNVGGGYVHWTDAEAGFQYFSVSKSETIKMFGSQGAPSATIEKIDNEHIASNSDFHKARLARIKKDDSGNLIAITDDGQNIPLSDNRYGVLKYEESLESYIEASRYELVKNEASDGITYTIYNDLGSPLSDSTDTGFTDTFYRQYLVIDILNDGSTVIPGKPLLVELDPYSENIGVNLNVSNADNTVAKRILCGSRFNKSKSNVFDPISQEDINSPLYIIREFSKGENTVFDGSPDDSLIRPITEVLPMTAGIPAIFGPGQINPHNICSFEDNIAIGGYTINRPKPVIHTTASGQGNIYLDKTGTDTATQTVTKTITIYFEYSDGTYSSKVTDTLFDTENTLTIHSLNQLIDTVHVYVDDGTTEYKLGSFNSTSPEFAGMPVKIPIDLLGLVQQSIPKGLNIVESINLSNYVTVPIPIQNIQISSQAKIFGNDSIVGIVPLDYDPDRNPLRYRLQVFTTDNIQTGYITEVVQGTIVSYSSNFEIATSSRRATSREGIKRIDGSIFFQDEQGINIMGGGQVNLLVDNDQYPIAQNTLTEVAFNEPDGEIWLLFNSNDVLVYDTKSQAIRTFSFGSGNLRTGSYHMNKLLITSGTDLCEAESGANDLGTPIVGKAITTPLGPNRIYTEIAEVHVVGNGSNVTLKVDDQPQRESYSTNFDGFDFTPQKTMGPKAVKMNGTIFAPGKRGIKMRLGFDFENQTTSIEEIIIKFINTKNVL